MTLSNPYSAKAQLYSKILLQKTTKSSFLQNLKIKKFSPLYFNGNWNQTISKKESFYQYLFIQSIFNDSSVNSFENPDFNSNFSVNRVSEMTPPHDFSKLSLSSVKTSRILENLTIVPSQKGSGKFINKTNFLKRHKKSNQFFHDKIFITYKKSFLCYWLLPFLGLVGTTAPTLFQATSTSPLLFNSKIELRTQKNVEGIDLMNGMNLEKQGFKPSFSGANIPESLENDYGLLLSSSSGSAQSQRLINKEKQNMSQSLLLTAFNFYKGTHLLKNKLESPNFSFSDFNFAILNRNIRARSEFKWYWFNLFLNKNPDVNSIDFFPAKISHLKLKASNFKGFGDGSQEFESIFNSLTDTSNKSDGFGELKQKKNEKLQSVFPLNFLNIAFENLQENLKNLKYSSRLTQLDSFDKIQDLNVEQKASLYSKIFQKSSLNDKSLDGNQFLIGIIKDKELGSYSNLMSMSNLIDKTPQIETNSSKSPYKSIKKASFLMDQLRSNHPELFTSKIFSSAKKQTKDINPEFNTHEKTILFIFKKNKKLNNLLNNPKAFVETIGAPPTRSKNINLGSKKLIYATDCDLLYNSIFEGLKTNLDLIIDSKANRIEVLPNNQNLNLKKMDFGSKMSVLLNPYKKCSLYKDSIPLLNYSSVKLESFLNKNKNVTNNLNTNKLESSLINPFDLLVNEFTSLAKKNSNWRSPPEVNFSVLKLTDPIKGGSLKKIKSNWRSPPKNLKNQNFFAFSSEKDESSNPFSKFYRIKNKKEIELNPTNQKEPLRYNHKEALFKMNWAEPLFSIEPKIKLNRSNYYNSWAEPLEIKLGLTTLKRDQNSFLFLSNYIELITNNIKKKLSPYKQRLTYLPELNQAPITNLALKPSTKTKNKAHLENQLNSEKSSIVYMGSAQGSSKFEKIFLSYLSKSKKVSKFSHEDGVHNSLEGVIENNLKLKTKTKLKESNPHFSHKKMPNLKNKSLNKNKSNLILLKNRLFTHKALSTAKAMNSDIAEKPQAFSNMEKKHNLKIKRRLKKMKCETRRRKKRKIFYPRPKWITFSMYKNFLNSRYSDSSKKLVLVRGASPQAKLKNGSFNPREILSKKMKEDKSFLSNQDFKSNWAEPLDKKSNVLFSNAKRSKRSKGGFAEDLFLRVNEKPYYSGVYSHWLNNKKNGSQGIAKLSQKAILKNTKDFYRISNNVFVDLKRVLMKSNWLRSYLNPYLDKVKTIYKETQKSSKKMHAYFNLKSLVSEFYGLNPSLLISLTDREILPISESNDISFPMFLNVKNSLCEAQNYLGAPPNTSLFKPKKSRGSAQNPSKTNSESREERINIVEYNRIVYQRVQRVILNIRDNLKLNGQMKNRSKKLGKNIRSFLKREYTKRDINNGLPVNQNEVLWSKIVKNNVLKFGRSFFSNGYEESSPYNNAAQLLSRNNFYWALNKSAMIPDGNFNTSSTKKLWETYKIREVSKNNQTKKIIFNMFMKYNRLFKSTNSLDGYNHILNSVQNNFKGGFAEEIKPSETNQYRGSAQKISSFFYKNDLFKDSQINYYRGSAQAYSFDEQVPKMAFTLPAKNYTLKSEQKLINIENKLKLLGLYSKKTERGYKNAYFRFLKNELLKENKFYYRGSAQPYSKNNLYSQNNFNSPKVKVQDLFGNIKQKSLNNLTGKNMFTDTFSNSENKTKMANNYSYWWSFFNGQKQAPNLEANETSFNVKTLKENRFYNFKGGFAEDNTKFYNHQEIYTKQRNKVSDEISFEQFPLTPHTNTSALASFLFHFCALVSFISLGGIRMLIKFYYILISKVSKLIGSVEGLVNLFPQKNSVNGIKINNTNTEGKKHKFDVTPMQSKWYKENWAPPLEEGNNNNKETFIHKRNKKRFQFIQENNQFGSPKQNDLIIKNLKLYFLKYLTGRAQKASKLNLNLDSFSEKSYYQLTPSAKAEKIFQIKLIKGGFAKDTNSGYLRALNKKSQFLVSDKLNNHRGSAQSILTNFKENIFLKQEKNNLNLSGNIFLKKKKLILMYSSFLKLSGITRLTHKLSFYTYLLLLRSVDIIAIPASLIYKFFEKPGEYVVENLAYSFLVEWSADLISTIPETVDTSQAHYFAKINRSVSPLILINFNLNQANIVTAPSAILGLNLLSSLRTGFLLSLNNNILKRLLNSSFLVFIQQLCEPDLDYINRQKKARSIWDIWGGYLKRVAEENSINVYELTTDKEEQVKLLSKYQESIFNTKMTHTDNWSKKRKNNLFSKLSSRGGAQLSSFSLNQKKQNKSSNLKNHLFDNISNQGSKNNLGAEPNHHHYHGWAVSQFLSYQGKDTDLFIDLHPPKNFSASAASLKYSFSVQQPIGSIVCQIFSGIFYKQISKNILVVGSAGLEKTLLIQAIAGETELKIITDNAHRYAMVYRGVAVGIKLLKDVFEALSVHTPCIFLMENIHAIGERRPFLIDEASPNSSDSTYNKNQSMQGVLLKEKSGASREGLYKNNKHLLSHYKKAYKEPRSLATNHFSFTFLFGDLFAKVRTNEIKLSSALSIQVMKKESENKYKNLKSKLKDQLNKKNLYSSSLLIKSSDTEGVAPPASSPFNVLILKEAAKLKHNKTVKEMPWFGLPGEQFSLVSKYNYSIRVKVALLADLVLSNLSVKLDMITDLLVIIDSVKANRGFVVFATTHLPYILDPALRRPGRFDETISLPLIPALYSRLANYRSNVQYLRTSLFNQYSIPLNTSLNKGTTLDLTNYNVISRQSGPLNQLINFINIQHSSPINQIKFEGQSFINLRKSTVYHTKAKDFLNDKSKLSEKGRHSAWKHLIPLFTSKTNLRMINNKNNLLPLYYSPLNLFSLTNTTSKYSLSLKNFKQNKEKGLFKSQKIQHHGKQISNKQTLQLKSKHYSYACKSLISLILYTSDPGNSNLTLKWPNMLKDLNSPLEDYSIYLTLFNSDKEMLKIILMSLMAGKIGENFVSSSNLKRNCGGCAKPHQNNFNFDKTWKYASSLLISYIQKAQCSALNKNLAFTATKLISFNNKYSLMEPPSPPISNILLPAKRYENYKRTFNNQYGTLTGQNHFSGSVSEKLQLHQQQRLLKRLYKYPIKEFFRSHILKGNQNDTHNDNDSISNFSNFNNSYLVLSPLEQTNLASVNKISNVNWSYRNILYNRHKTYLTNQWWNGQQGEHNAEKTFLSDIDWRYTFVSSIGDIHIDFPDSEQFYNPRNRRWVLTHGDWNSWFNSSAQLKDIYSHYLYEAFTKAYQHLDQNREVLDFYVESLHQAPLATELKDRNLLNLYKRF